MTLYTYPLIDIQGPTGPTGPTGALGYTGSQGSGYTGSASTVEGPTGATGADGVVGYRGSQGDTGYTGSLGFTGSAGADGVVGYRGSQGDLGFTGSRGVIGYTGSSGTIGYVGSVGLRGFTGYTGSKGDLGFTGSAGQDGFVGSQGLRGFTGFTGYTGSVGFTGSRGEGGTGYTGSQGAGSTGYTGSKGDLGFTGSKGDSGEFGAVGYVGSRGDQGFTGSQGNQGVGYVGSRGADAAGYTGSVGYTGSAGTSGTTGFTGSVGAGDTGYVGSRGEVGFTGSRGDLGTVGYTGSQGLLGATGYVGSRGEDAAVGYRGSQGDTGYTGSIGAVGFTGSIGFTGSVGYTGSRGDVGYTGSVGFTGSQGAGYTGSVGYTGSTGYTGSVGYTGSEGVRGQKGDVGYTGSLGVGTVGYTGSRGVIGYTGSQGPSGTGGFSAIPSSTAVAPGFPLAVDANTGLFGNTDDNIGISTGGVGRVLVTNNSTTFTNTTSGSSTAIEGGEGIFRVSNGVNQVAINRNVDIGTTSGLVLNTDGNLEIIRSTGGAYINFRTSITSDFVRITQVVNNSIAVLAGTLISRTTGGAAEIRDAANYSNTIPVYAFYRNSNTGMGNPAENVINFITSNVENMRLTSSGFMGVGTNDPQSRLHVNGLITSQGTNLLAGIKLLNTTEGAGRDWRVLQKNTGYFAITDETAGQERLTINGAGGTVAINAPAGLFVQSGGLTVNDSIVSATGNLQANLANLIVGQAGTSADKVLAMHNGSRAGFVFHQTTGRMGMADSASFTGGLGNIRWFSEQGADGANNSFTVNGNLTTNQNLLFNSNYGSAAVAYGCRAWVKFNGQTGAAIQGAGNVSSVTYLAPGQYRVNFIIAMPDAGYAVTFSMGDIDGVGTEYAVLSDYATTSFIIRTAKYPDDWGDAQHVCVAVFR